MYRGSWVNTTEMNTLFGLLLVGACTYVYAPPPPPAADVPCVCPRPPCPTGYSPHSYSGRCCGVCKPVGGGAQTACPPLCYGRFGKCAESWECQGLGKPDECTDGKLCCSNGCGTICADPIIVQTNTGPDECKVGSQSYAIGDVFMDVAADGTCEYCQCMSTGDLVCKPDIVGPGGL